jgi:succinyl-CoA synthetase beta subunit
MDLLEYQAKELFQEVSIPVLPAQKIETPTDLKALQIPYPVVLKSQVSAGSRGKAGGVRFVENTIDAIAAARTIFNLSIAGEYPQVLLAETKYNTSREFYLAIAIDRLACRPVLLGASEGGMNLNAILQQIQQVVVYEDFSPFYARRLALKMGLDGELMLAVSNIIQKMYKLMESYDLDSVEINPLGVDREGKVMALDGKITVNPASVDRHPQIQQWQTARPVLPSLYTDKGNIGILTHGIGAALSILDGINQGGGKVARCTVVYPTTLDRVQTALTQLSADGVEVLLVNLVGSSPDIYRQVLASFPPHYSPQIIWRILDRELETIAPNESSPIKFITDLDRAIAQTLSHAKEVTSD